MLCICCIIAARQYFRKDHTLMKKKTFNVAQFVGSSHGGHYQQHQHQHFTVIYTSTALYQHVLSVCILRVSPYFGLWRPLWGDGYGGTTCGMSNFFQNVKIHANEHCKLHSYICMYLCFHLFEIFNIEIKTICLWYFKDFY